MESRVNKSIRNAIVGMIGLFVNLIVTFVSKSIFVRLLGAEYNGVNGLFTNILNVLNLAELGFSIAIAYSLYAPLREHNEILIAQLMNYFVSVYRIIAAVVAIAGCICIPFLQYLIAEDISELPFTLSQLRIYFALFLANTVFGYLLAYKRTIIEADQNAYIITGVDNICNVVLNITQIVLLLIYKNYYAYLAIMIAKTIINYLILHIIAGKKYPYLSKYKSVKLGREYKSSVFKNVKAMFLSKIGYSALYSTTSIVISAFVSLIDAGKYANYLMITSNIYAFVSIIFSAASASIGNLCAGDDRRYQYKIFLRIQYLAYFFAIFTFSCYVCLFNDFIEIWLGSDMMMSFPVVVIISFNAMVLYLRRVPNTFRDAQAFYRYDKYKPVLEVIFGLGFAIGLSYVWGTFGVILGYTLVMLFVSYIIENFTLYKYGFGGEGLIKQLLTTLSVILFAFVLATVMYWICSYFPKGLGWFILKFIFCVLFAAGVFILVTCRTDEFKYYRNLAIAILKKLGGKLKTKIGKKAAMPKSANGNNAVGDDTDADYSCDNESCPKEKLLKGENFGGKTTDEYNCNDDNADK